MSKKNSPAIIPFITPPAALIDFEKALREIGYNSIGEFLEVACAITLMIEKDLPTAQAMSPNFALQCGHLMDAVNYTSELIQRTSVNDAIANIGKQGIIMSSDKEKVQ